MTEKQRELYLFIKSYMKEKKISPSFEECRIALGLKSKSGIHRLIRALEERSVIITIPHRARSIELLDNDNENQIELELMHDFLEKKNLLAEFETFKQSVGG